MKMNDNWSEDFTSLFDRIVNYCQENNIGKSEAHRMFDTGIVMRSVWKITQHEHDVHIGCQSSTVIREELPPFHLPAQPEPCEGYADYRGL